MKDAVGNELHVGDLVLLQLERPLIYGRIVEAEEGGLVTGINHKGGTEIRPGKLVVAANYPVEFDPRQFIRAVVALRDGTGERLEAEEKAQRAN